MELKLEMDKRLINVFYEYEETQRKYTFFCEKYKWLLDCPYNIDEEKHKTKKDVIRWRDATNQKRDVLIRELEDMVRKEV